MEKRKKRKNSRFGGGACGGGMKREEMKGNKNLFSSIFLAEIGDFEKKR